MMSMKRTATNELKNANQAQCIVSTQKSTAMTTTMRLVATIQGQSSRRVLFDLDGMFVQAEASGSSSESSASAEPVC